MLEMPVIIPCQQGKVILTGTKIGFSRGFVMGKVDQLWVLVGNLVASLRRNWRGNRAANQK